VTVLYFIIAISVLVVIHEYGHFWVARRCGVKVIRFSVGFGKPFWSFRDRHGTEFSVAPIPLGGYVKMVDEREGDVPPELLDQAFTQKPAWQRIAIASAGPLANFIFAFIAYWFIAVAGTTGVAPVVGELKADGPAEMAGVHTGDEIIAINGEEVSTWQEVNWELVGYIGEDTELNIRLLSESGGQREVQIPVYSWLADQDTPDPMTALGVEPRRLQLDPVMGTIEPGGAAERAGMQLGDRILAVDGRAVNSWAEWVEEIKVAANKPLSVLVERNGQETTLNLTPAAKDRDGEQIGYVGTAPVIPEVPESWLRTSHAGFFQGIWIGLSKTSDYIVFTLESLWKMIAGDVSVKNLSGPITIAKVAGASASGGLESFISFLALLSVSLGVLNLLPVPMLDGGHIVFYLAEMIRGKPLPDKVQDVAVRFGLMLIMSLMLVAFYNDISRL